MGVKSTAYTIMVEMLEEKRPLGRLRWWVYIVKMDLRDGVVRIGLLWLRIGISGGQL
jgi:hypothetical protein